MRILAQKPFQIELFCSGHQCLYLEENHFHCSGFEENCLASLLALTLLIPPKKGEKVKVGRKFIQTQNRTGWLVALFSQGVGRYIEEGLFERLDSLGRGKEN